MPLNYLAFALLTLGLTALVAVLTARTAHLLANWPLDQNPLLYPSENVAKLLLIGVCIGLGLLSGLPPEQLGWRFDAPLARAGWGLFWGLVLTAVYYFSTRALVRRTGERYYSTLVLRIIVPRSRRELFLVALAMLPVVALEELLFRSLLIGGFTPVAPVWLLILASSIVFGLMHLPQGIWGVGAVTVGGVLLGWLLVESGSLLAPAVAHYVANLAQLGLAYGLKLVE